MTRFLAIIGLFSVVAFFLFDAGNLVLRYRAAPANLPAQVFYAPQQILGRKDLSATDVLILGGSSTRELFGHEGELEQFLSNQCGRPVSAFNASTSSQSLSESLALIRLFRKNAGDPDVIIMGLTKWRITRPDHRRHEEDQLMKIGLSMSPDAFSGLEWPQRMTATLSGAIERFKDLPILLKTGSSWKLSGIHEPNPPVVYDGLDPLSLPKRIAISIAYADIAQSDSKAHSVNNAKWAADAISRAVDEIPVVFLMTPVSPVTAALSYPESDPLELRQAIQILAKNQSFHDLRRAESLGLTDDDFWDEQHLLRAGRKRLWASGPLGFTQSICAEIK
jgi:hypothetical protein